MRTIANVTNGPAVATEPARFPASSARLLAVLATAAVLTACADEDNRPSAPPAPAVSASIAPITPTAPAASAALAAYGEFWRISEQAVAAPTSKDWEAELSAVARGQALEDVLLEIRNYASVPAHVEGTITHEPVVDPAAAPAPDRVVVLDCVDISASDLVSDADGAILDDQVNERPRYRYRAVVVQGASGRWLVETTKPLLDQPC